MIRQDDIELNNMSEIPFEEYGCALFDIQYLSVMHGINVFKRANFLYECEQWIKSGIILKNTKIMNWDRLCQDSGLPYRLVFENKTHKLHPLRKLGDNELQLLYLFNPETGLHHFVVANKYDQVVYDSLGESVTVAAYERGVAYIESRRVFRRIS